MSKLFIPITICFICYSPLLNAQSINLFLDPINPYSSQVLYNLTMINASDYTGKVMLNATLKDNKGKILVEQKLNVSIQSGETKGIRGTTIQPQTTSIAPEFNIIWQNAQLPPLNYILCLEAIASGESQLKSESCIEYYSSDLIQISAVYPPDEAEISDQRPLFSWIDPQPQDYLSYQLRLVELKDNQRPTVALRRNEPLISMDNINGTQLIYPSDAIPLENSKSYAWQIGVTYNGETLSRSEPSEFTFIDNEEFIEISKNQSYVDLKRVQHGELLYAVGEFKFKYESNIQSELSVELYEIKKDMKKTIPLPAADFSLNSGFNKYEIDLTNDVYLKHLQQYYLHFKDKTKDVDYLVEFLFINPEYIK